MRKIVQIAVQASSEEMLSDGRTLKIHAGLMAMCDDGTVWFRRSAADEWNRLPDIPQDQPPAKEAE